MLRQVAKPPIIGSPGSLQVIAENVMRSLYRMLQAALGGLALAGGV
ncbi:hypothetical protein [Streptomyces lucensis]|nr:hypothetical protein [Streptomyces lucensis]